MRGGQSKLRRQYHRLSYKYHPDHFRARRRGGGGGGGGALFPHPTHPDFTKLTAADLKELQELTDAAALRLQVDPRRTKWAS